MDESNVLYVQMLGGFHMMYQGKSVLLGKNLSSKMLHLLLLLLYSREEGIRREKILEQLYSDTDGEKASDSLRAMVYRLRKGLVAAGLPEDEYITTKGGIYRWQSATVEIVLDVEEFRKKVIAALEEADEHVKRRLLEEACRMYAGEFLPSMIGDDWVSAANWKYQELYFKCLRALAELLKQQRRYTELLEYCEQVLTKYPYEEWQLLKLNCLTDLKEYKEALRYYDEVVEESQSLFGMLPSREVIEAGRNIKNMIQFEMNGIEEIQDHMRDGETWTGATRCDYLSFIEVYRHTVRMMVRNGSNAFLVLLTLVGDDGVPLEHSELLEEARQVLDRVLITSMRRSDMYTRYGKNQFLILVVNTDEEGCEIVIQRILRGFHAGNRRKKVDVYHTYRPALENDEAII